MGIRGGEYAQVVAIEQKANRLTVRKADGSTLTYNPLRLRGVNVFREQEINVAVGDRIQMTAPFKAKRVANRELGTVEAVDAAGNLRVKLDSGRAIEFNIAEHRSIDYGYATTSHSAQGLSSRRTLLHVDTEQSKQLVNRRFGYVAISRAADDVQIYTNNAKELHAKLARYVTKESALEIASEQQIAERMGFSA